MNGMHTIMCMYIQYIVGRSKVIKQESNRDIRELSG